MYDTLYPALNYKPINYSDVVRVPTPGIAVAFQGFRLPPGARAYARALPQNAGIVYIAKFSRPRVAALTPAGGAFTLRSTDEMPIELDSQVLSQWFVDADTANEGVQVWIEMNQ